MCHAQPWPLHQVSWSALTFWLSTYGILRGVSCSYALKGHKIVSKPWKFMEISIYTSSKSGGEGILFLWFGVLLVSISVHISEHFQKGANWVNVLYIWHQMQGICTGQLAQSKGKIWDINKAHTPRYELGNCWKS